MHARRDHQQGQGGGGGHARQPHVAAARVGNDVRAGGRDGRRRRRRAGRAGRRDQGERRRTRATASSDSKWRAKPAATCGASSPPRSSAAAGACSSCGPMRMSLEDVFLKLTTQESDAPADGVEPPSARSRTAATWRWPMSNVLAIARKELRSYFASPIAYIVIGLLRRDLRLLLRRHPALLRTQSMQAGRAAARPVNVNEQLIRPVFLNVGRGVPVHAAARHDAHLRGGEALGHDRAAAHGAAHRPADHPRQVPRRDGALRVDAGCHAASTSARCSSSARPSGGRCSPPTWACCSWAAASCRWACSSRA